MLITFGNPYAEVGIDWMLVLFSFGGAGLFYLFHVIFEPNDSRDHYIEKGAVVGFVGYFVFIIVLNLLGI